MSQHDASGRDASRLNESMPPALRAGVVVAAIVVIGLLLAMVGARSCQGAPGSKGAAPAPVLPGVPVMVRVRTVDVIAPSRDAPPTALMNCLGISDASRAARVRLNAEALSCVDSLVAPLGGGSQQTLMARSGEGATIQVESSGAPGARPSRSILEVTMRPEALEGAGVRLDADVREASADGPMEIQLQDIGIPIGTRRQRLEALRIAPDEAIGVWVPVDGGARLIVIRAEQQ